MSQSYASLITNGFWAMPSGTAEADLGLRNGKIVDLGTPCARICRAMRRSANLYASTTVWRRPPKTNA